MDASGNQKRDERLAILERDSAGRRVYDRLSAVELAQGVNARRLDDHDHVLSDIRDHLSKLTEAVATWKTRLTVLIAVIAVSSPLAGKLLAQLFS